MCYVLRGGSELREIVRNVAVGIMKLDLPRIVRTSVFRYLLLNVLNFKYLNLKVVIVRLLKVEILRRIKVATLRRLKVAILRQVKVDTILQNFTYFAALIYIRRFLDISFYYVFKGDLAQMLIMIRILSDSSKTHK